jgi:hypothetical protein
MYKGDFSKKRALTRKDVHKYLLLRSEGTTEQTWKEFKSQLLDQGAIIGAIKEKLDEVGLQEQDGELVKA